MLGDALAEMPASIQARLFAAFGLELIYNKEDHQVSIYATITPAPPKHWPRSSQAASPQPNQRECAIPCDTPEGDGCHKGAALLE